MIRLFLSAALAGWLGGLVTGAQAQDQASRAAPALELEDGDRVVFVGDALFEREGELGYLETELTERWPERRITFRNLGWTGDTVWGDSRAFFESAREGFQRRTEAVLGLKPSVIFLSYGMNESFGGRQGLDRFEEGLRALLEALEPSGARMVLISPIVHERLGPPLPDPGSHNKDLARYRDVMAKVAQERKLWFVDLFGAGVGDGRRPKTAAFHPETMDGIHLNRLGYARAAEVIMRGINAIEPPIWNAVIDAEEPAKVVPHIFNIAAIKELESTAQGLRFESRANRLPCPPLPAELPDVLRDDYCRMRVLDLPKGRYALKIDGKLYASADAEGWNEGVALHDSPDRRQSEALRRAIVEKNALYFHRQRPENMTYLYGFRKHEQGQNAAEVPRFDALVESAEARVSELKKPVPHLYELVREETPR